MTKRLVIHLFFVVTDGSLHSTEKNKLRNANEQKILRLYTKLFPQKKKKKKETYKIANYDNYKKKLLHCLKTLL